MKKIGLIPKLLGGIVLGITTFIAYFSTLVAGAFAYIVLVTVFKPIVVQIAALKGKSETLYTISVDALQGKNKNPKLERVADKEASITK